MAAKERFFEEADHPLNFAIAQAFFTIGFACFLLWGFKNLGWIGAVRTIQQH
jgi:hypothetical protein